MVQLLKVLTEWLSFFFTENRYRLVHSEVGTSFGNALIEFASDVLRWRLVRDRSQIFLDCCSERGKRKASDWYSTDVLIPLISGRRVESAELTEEYAKWLQANLTDIEARFSSDRLEQTTRELKELERRRAKELFG